MATRGGMEAAAGPRGRPGVENDVRRLRRLLEARQRHLRARMAACEELRAEMAALQAALRAGCRPPCLSSGSGPAAGSSGPGSEGDAEPCGASAGPPGNGCGSSSEHGGASAEPGATEGFCSATGSEKVLPVSAGGKAKD
ncbi:uncharacterized protein LJ206_019049 [Theristicus caerulescens]